MILGQDLSHHNPKAHMLGNSDFIWLKATEGKTYTDPELEGWISHIADKRRYSLPVMGFYHYAHPENGNGAADEAGHFLKTVSPHTGKCLLALDLEGDALSTGASRYTEWCRQWVEKVYETTGVTPYIYCGESVAKNIAARWREHPQFWIARWNTEKRPAMAEMWQFTSKPFDMSVFYGSKDQLALRALPH